MNPVEVARYLETLALAGNVDDKDRLILLAASNIVLATAQKGLEES